MIDHPSGGTPFDFDHPFDFAQGDDLIAQLGEKLDLTAEEIADVIWLTMIRQQGTIADSTESKTDTATVVVNCSSAVTVSVVSSSLAVGTPTDNRPQTKDAVAGIAPRRSQTTPLDCIPIKVTNPRSIRDPLSLARSLRPLMRQVPSGQIEGLDEQATAQQVAEAGIWQPIVKPALEPWLELVLVADESISMLIWRQTVLEFRNLLRNYGTFRDVQLWGMHWEDPPQPFGRLRVTPSLKSGENRLSLRPGIGSEAISQAPRQPQELIDPSGRRLIVLMTDGVAAYWQSEALIKTLRLWAQYSPVAIAQVLPEWLWVRTAFRGFESVQLKALEPGIPNNQLIVDWSSAWQPPSDLKAGVSMPILPLEPDAVMTWSQMVMGTSVAPGYWMQSFPMVVELCRNTEPEQSEPASLSPKQRVEQFQVMSSPVAQRLMGLVAASPVITLPVIRLIQETLLPKSRQMNVAEVLLGGLLEPINPPQLGANPDQVEYRFVDEAMRELLLAEIPVPDTVQVLSEYINRQFDKSLVEFVADLQIWSRSEDAALVDKSRAFATVTASVLKRKGGKYRELVDKLQKLKPDPSNHLDQNLHQLISNEPFVGAQSRAPLPYTVSANKSFPPLQEFEFETARIAFEEEETQPLQPFEFEIATVEVQQKGLLRRQSQVVIKRQPGQAWGYVERLSETVELEMVAIPEGKFMMGSSENEPERYEDESPQHEVSVPAFFMGKYPVTQAQWRVVAGLPQVERKLEPNPSQFKGEHHPVENVSWQEVTEFCTRLSELTGKPYGLPSEAEWEYACRAGTKTPFHFGELITPDLANYDWDKTYGAVKVTKSKDFQGTTPVGSFGVANAFGLYDLHGNVWEWCEDHWHGSYQRAPIDSSAWIDKTLSEKESHVLRGGSWDSNPRNCRSATRDRRNAGIRINYIGFRVVCRATRTL